MQIRPIGLIRSPFTEPEGMPIQPSGAAGVKGLMEVLPEYAAGLQDLDGFTYWR
jgi:tRNA (Thr-GGU) A37 N-methylase